MLFPDFITQEPDGYIHLIDYRIGIQDIVFHYNEGYSAEMLLEEYPTLSLALIHKSLGFYLDNRAEIDAYVKNCEETMERLRATAKKGPSLEELRNRMELRKRLDSKQRAEAL